MPDRNLVESTFRQVTNVVAENPADIGKVDAPGLLEIGAQVGGEILKQNEQAKLAANFSHLQNDMNQMELEIQNEFRLNPQGGVEKFKKERQKLIDGYSDNVSLLYRGQWRQSVKDLATSSDATQEKWMYTQTYKNTVAFTNEAVKTSLDQAMMDGRVSGQSEDQIADSLVNFSNSYKNLETLAINNLGEAEAAALLKGYENKHMKSFMYGLAQSNPVEADRLLSDETVQEKISFDDMVELKNYAKKNLKVLKTQTLAAQMDNEQAVVDFVSDRSINHLDKKLAIDTQELTGQISTKVATSARRVLKSQQEVDAVTNDDVIADIIGKTYDINTIADMDQEAYLTGVQNIRAEILDKRASGELSRADEIKLNGQLQRMTGNKVADATDFISFNFGEASDLITDSLPPEYRGRAIRQLFYETEGQDNLSEQAYFNKANNIVDTINNERRNVTLKKAEKIINSPVNLDVSNDAFLEELGYTREDIAETAIKYNMTDEQVIQRLRAN